jgi:aspartyl-tRNA(Asn)/glutamyl-tRNA(Gln) amidotransferase subunit C
VRKTAPPRGGASAGTRSHTSPGSVARVGEVAADDIPPTSHAVPLQNVFRPDELRPGLTQEQALAGAPAAEDGRFRVPQILGEEA